MSEILLVENGEIFLSAAMLDRLAAGLPYASKTQLYRGIVPEGVGTVPPGLKITVLSEAELEKKAETAAPWQPAPHPRAASREAQRRRRQMEKRAARAGEAADV